MTRSEIILDNISKLTPSQLKAEVEFLSTLFKKMGQDKEVTSKEFNKLHSLVTPNGLLYNVSYNEPRKAFGAEQIPVSEEKSMERKIDNYLLNNTDEWKKWKKE